MGLKKFMAGLTEAPQTNIWKVKHAQLRFRQPTEKPGKTPVSELFHLSNPPAKTHTIMIY